MSEQGFDIIFRGDIVIGHQLQQVKQSLQQLFKADEARIQQLFAGRPVPLKRGLDAATAEKYRAVLFKAGAMVEVRPAASGAAARDAGTAGAATTAAPVAAGFSLAPPGSLLLTVAERRRLPPVEIDTSGISVRDPEGGYLLDPQERPSLPVDIPEAPEFDLAPVGEMLLRDGEITPKPAVEVAIRDWGLSPVEASAGQSEQ